MPDETCSNAIKMMRNLGAGISVKRPPKWFKPKQLQLMALLADPADRRPLAEKAKQVGVSRRTVFNWRRMPGWTEGQLLLWTTHFERRRRAERQQAHAELARVIAGYYK